MLRISVTGFGSMEFEYLISDFTGTLSLDGKLLPAVREKLNMIAKSLKVYVLTADTFGKAREELKDVDCTLHMIKGENLDVQKEEFLRRLSAEKVVAIGNGMNDRRMLKAARLGIAVMGSEGCATEALFAAKIVVSDVSDGLDLLLNPKRVEATLKH